MEKQIEPLVTPEDGARLNRITQAIAGIAALSGIYALLSSTGRMGRNEKGACEFLVLKLHALVREEAGE